MSAIQLVFYGRVDEVREKDIRVHTLIFGPSPVAVSVGRPKEYVVGEFYPFQVHGGNWAPITDKQLKALARAPTWPTVVL